MALKLVTSGFVPEDDVEALAEAKLSSSGITKEQARDLGMEWLTADEVKALNEGHWFLPALKLPYFDPEFPDKALSSAPQHPAFYRLRALREPVPKDKKFRKYLQEAESGVCAYLPRTTAWKGVMEDWKAPLIITEGEFKAACACLRGLPTIGLGGVYSFRCIDKGHMLLPELTRFVWPRRTVYIVFDSDARRNENVCKALWELATELQSRGALPRTIILPDDGVTKVGLDDFLVASGKEAFQDLLKESDPLTLADILWNINKEFVYVEEPGLVVRQSTGFLMKPDALRTHAMPKVYMANKLLPNGMISRHRVGAGDAWVDWGLRTTARSVSYIPGATPRSVVDVDGTPYFNTWPGWGAEPKKGDVSLFIKLIDHLFSGADSESKAYFLRWLAYPIVHPGVKMLVSAVIHGVAQGSGKSLIGVTMGKVYGSNYTMVTQETMESAFNNWASYRQFIMVDDVTATDRRRDIDRLKAMITRESVWINIKHIPEFSVKDCINYYFNSNRQDALFLDPNDRRFFIHEVTANPASTEFYAAYDAWLHGSDCGAAVHHYLKNEVDITGFNPNAAPPITSAKRKMVQLARTDVEDWIAQLLDSPDDFLKFGEVEVSGDLFTLSEIRAFFESYQGKPLDMSQTTLSRKLASQGVRQVNDGKNLYVPGRKLDRYWALRNREKWHKIGVDAARRHLAEVAAANRMRGA